MEDRTEVVARTWPYDGPHDADSVTTAAGAMDELTKYLTNATRSPAPLPYPATVYDVLGSLSRSAHQLDQLLQQLAAALDHQAQTTGLVDLSSGSPVPASTRTAYDQLRAARHSTATLAQVLEAAQQETAQLELDPDGQ